MTEATDRHAIIILGDDLLAVTLAASAAQRGARVQVLIEPGGSRSRARALPGLLLPAPGRAQGQLQRYARWLGELGIAPADVALTTWPCVRGDARAPVSEVGVVDLARLRAALARILAERQVEVGPARGAQPAWDAGDVIGVQRPSGAILPAREVVLASGLRLGRCWLLPASAEALGGRALVRQDPVSQRDVYVFPFGGRVCVTPGGDAPPEWADLPAPARPTGAPQRISGIGPDTALRPYAVQRHAPGLIYAWSRGGQGLVTAPLLTRRVYELLGLDRDDDAAG